MYGTHLSRPLEERENTSEASLSIERLLVLLSFQLGRRIGDLDLELFGALHDELSLSGGDVVGNLGAVLSVVHEKELELGNVVNLKLVQSVRKNVSRLLVATVSDVTHGNTSTESAANTAIDTARFSPGLIYAFESVGLEALELLLALHDLLHLFQRNNFDHL